MTEDSHERPAVSPRYRTGESRNGVEQRRSDETEAPRDDLAAVDAALRLKGYAEEIEKELEGRDPDMGRIRRLDRAAWAERDMVRGLPRPEAMPDGRMHNSTTAHYGPLVERVLTPEVHRQYAEAKRQDAERAADTERAAEHAAARAAAKAPELSALSEADDAAIRMIFQGVLASREASLAAEQAVQHVLQRTLRPPSTP